jgi:hypothetical protein
MTINIKLFLLTLILVLFSGFTYFVYSSGRSSRDSEVTSLQNSLTEVNTISKQALQKQKEVANETEHNYQTTISDINRYYSNRMLHPKTDSGASPSSPSTKESDATSTEPSVVGQSLEQACVLDASHVVAFQEWIKRNGFPIGEENESSK